MVGGGGGNSSAKWLEENCLSSVSGIIFIIRPQIA